MPDLKWRGLRPFLMKLHLYLSLGLGGLVALTALSGAPLVWRDNVDRALNPDRYAITGSNIAQSAATYLARAKAAVVAEKTRDNGVRRVVKFKREPDQLGTSVQQYFGVHKLGLSHD